jgi:hypothetical protein
MVGSLGQGYSFWKVVAKIHILILTRRATIPSAMIRYF